MKRVIDQFPFAFYDELFVSYLAEDRELYLVLRDLTEALDLDYSGQYRRVNRHPAIVERLENLTVDRPYQETVRSMEVVCMQLRALPYWLGNIDANRVKKEKRDKVILFQREFVDVAWAAFRSEILPPDLLAELDTHLPQELQKYHELMDAAAQWRQFMQGAGHKLGVLEERVSGLEARFEGTDFINFAQAKSYQDMVGALAYALADTKRWSKSKAFATVHNTVKKQFQVPSYQLIPEQRFPEVVDFLASWYKRTLPEEPLPAPFMRATQDRLL